MNHLYRPIHLLTLALASLALVLQSQAQNLSLVGSLSYSTSLSDIWGYSAPGGHEYALVGVRDGLSIVDVTTDASNPTELHFIGGPSSTWRDIKVWGDHAYVIHDSPDFGPGVGLLIVDMSNMPTSVDTLTITDFGSGVSFTQAHNIFIDENGFLYVCGADYGVGGVIMFDLNGDPEAPAYAGLYDDYYVHDLFVRGDTLWTGEIYQGWFGVIDVSVKSAPVVLATQTTATSFTHNVWLSDDGATLFTTDEVAGGYIGSYDVSDLSDIDEIDTWRSNPGSGVIPHNSFVYGDHLVTSYYRDGVTIHDISKPDNIVLVGNYDTNPQAGSGFDGCWGAYPYNPSGLIFATDVVTGFYVLDPTYVSASYLSGTVTEVGGGSPIAAASVEILGTTGVDETDILGSYGTGTAQPGMFDVKVSALGYESKTIADVSLSTGVVTTLDVELEPLATFTLAGQVVEAVTGNPIKDAQIRFVNEDFEFSAVADASGNFSLLGVYEATYDIIAGEWGYISELDPARDLGGSTGSVILELEKGYYDDFSLDFDWLGLGGGWAGGKWERAAPVAYDPGYGYPVTTAADVDGDWGAEAFVTGNSSSFDIVHASSTSLLSPEFDARIYEEPVIKFSAYIFNTDLYGAISNDGLIVKINDGSTTFTLDTIVPDGVATPMWREFEYLMSEFVEPGATMKLIVEASADGYPYIVTDVLEAGFDYFRVEEQEQPSAIGDPLPSTELSPVYPNPVDDRAWIELQSPQNGDLTLTVYGVTGKRYFSKQVEANDGKVRLEADALHEGMYLFELLIEGERLSAGRFAVHHR